MPLFGLAIPALSKTQIDECALKMGIMQRLFEVRNSLTTFNEMVTLIVL